MPYEDGITIDALWLSFEKTSQTVLMLNDNTIMSSGASVEEYAALLRQYERDAYQLKSDFNVNVLIVYYRGYVMYMKKKYKELMNDS